MAGKAVIVTESGRVIALPLKQTVPNPLTGKPMPVTSWTPPPGWAPPANPAIGPSGPYSEQGPFARPY